MKRNLIVTIFIALMAVVCMVAAVTHISMRIEWYRLLAQRTATPSMNALAETVIAIAKSPLAIRLHLLQKKPQLARKKEIYRITYVLLVISGLRMKTGIMK